MPYIKEKKRKEIVTCDGDRIRIHEIRGPGDLNFAITHLVKQYAYYNTEAIDGKLSYQLINDIVGAMEGAKLEFYRKVVVPYEEGKESENGPVNPIKFPEDDNE